jgi:hypothetical protein
MTQVLPHQSVYLLCDNKLNAILGVFSTELSCDLAMRQLIREDLFTIKRLIDEDIINDSYMDLVEATGILQQINFVLEDASKRLTAIHVTYNGYCPNQRYRMYIKNLDDFEIKTKNNSKIIILQKKI